MKNSLLRNDLGLEVSRHTLMTDSRKNQGFTLVELMILMGIVAITLAFALPYIPEWIANMRLRGAARDLASNFQLAKMGAANRNTFCTVTFDLAIGGQTYDYVVYVDTDQDLAYDAGEIILKRTRFSDSGYKGIGFDTSQGGGNGLTFLADTVAFSPRGLVIDTNQNIIAAGADSVFITNNRGKTKQISVSSAGGIRISQ
jgi:prepilin-type N-terminal cleavage/methylation domain-containing protein